jgi:pyridoxine 5-phosphate synthase
MTVLSVNLNKIALVRNSRDGHRPSVVGAARTAIAAGAAGITVHPRPDQRHIRPHDVTDLAALLAADYPHIEFNIEGNPAAGPTAHGYPGFDALIETTRPAQATLVPDSDDQLTSDHGWDLVSGFNEELAQRIARYQASGARVSLFMDPQPAQLEQAKAHGADRVELYTGPFAETFWAQGADHPATRESFARYRSAAQYATSLGLGVNAGHDLDLDNLPLFCEIREVAEVSIGHALISDALDIGLKQAVSAYVAILASA